MIGRIARMHIKRKIRNRSVIGRIIDWFSVFVGFFIYLKWWGSLFYR